MLSGDSFESSLSAGLGSGIVDNTIALISIHDIKTEDELILVTDTLIEKYLLNDPSQNHPPRRTSLTIVNEPLSYLNSEKSFGSSYHTNTLLGQLTKKSQFNSQSSKIYTSEDIIQQKQTIQGNAEFLQRGKNIHPLVTKVTNIKHEISVKPQLKIHPNYLKFTLFIDSTSLEICLESKEGLKKLVMLMFCANSICFTSLLPSHKTKIAKILDSNFTFKPVYIGIGDGGSDVGLIKTAGIGIGILGQEGNQAASSSDIFINDFSDLKELILHQGFLSKYSIKKSIMLGAYSISLLFTLIFLLNLSTDYSGNIFIPED